MSADHRAIASRIYSEVFEGGDIDLIDDLLTDDFVDHELSPEDYRRVEAHLDTCQACAARFAAEARALSTLRDQIQRLDAPAGILRRTLDNLDRKQ